MARVGFAGLIIAGFIGLTGCQADSAADAPLAGPPTAISIDDNPAELGQVIISQDGFIARVDARDRPVMDLSSSDQKEIIEYIQSIYQPEDGGTPPNVLYQDGEFVIDNLNTDFESTAQQQFSGPRRLKDGLWVFDSGTSTATERTGAAKITADLFKIAAPESQTFEEAVKAVDNLYDISELMNPALLEPLMAGSSGYAKNLNMSASNLISAEIDFIAWQSDAETQTISMRLDGVQLALYQTQLSFDHFSVTDFHYPSFFEGVEKLTRRRYDFAFPNWWVQFVNPFQSPFRSISIQNFEYLEQAGGMELDRLNMWVTDEEDGKFENHNQIEGFRHKTKPEMSSRASYLNLVPLADFGFYNVRLDYKSHAQLDQNSDRWIETIEFVSPQLSSLRANLDISGYAKILTFVKQPPMKDDAELTAAIENWHVRDFDIFWNDNDALLNSMIYMDGLFGTPSTTEELLADYDEDLGDYWFRGVTDPGLLAYKSKYVEAMKAAARDDGVLTITTNPPSGGVSMSGLTEVGRAPPEKEKAAFLDALNFEIIHRSYGAK